jgi:hypothetical protein
MNIAYSIRLFEINKLNLIGIPVNIDLLLFGCDVNSITHND